MPTRAEVSRDAQLAIAAQAALLAAKAWPSLDLSRLKATLPRFRLEVAAAIRYFSPAAARAATRFYLQQRTDAGFPNAPRLSVEQAPSIEHIGASVNWATEPLWGESDLPAAEKRLEAVVERMVLDVGRRQILTAVNEDRQATGWARIPEGDCCYFCAMLSTRGAVYKSEATAGRDSNDRLREIDGVVRKFVGPGEFKVHDHCRCHAEPVFGSYRLPSNIVGWTQDWYDLKREHGGVTLELWRDFFEGRGDFAAPASAEPAA